MDPKSVSPKQLFFEVLRSVVLLIEWFFSFWPIVLHSDPNKKVKKMWELWLLWSDDWCDTLNLEQYDIFVYFTTFLSSTCNSVLSNQFQFFISASFAPAHCLKVTLKSLVKFLIGFSRQNYQYFCLFHIHSTWILALNMPFLAML